MPDLRSELETLTELLEKMEPTEAVKYVQQAIVQVRRSLPD